MNDTTTHTHVWGSTPKDGMFQCVDCGERSPNPFRRPTPAQDALVDYEATANEARQNTYLTVGYKYESMTAAAVKSEAKKIRHSQITTKQAAIRVLAEAAFRESDEWKTLRRLEREAALEEEIYKSIDFSKVRYENARAEIVADAQNENKRLETLMGTVADARQAQVIHWQWAHVESLIENGDTPREALMKVREQTTKELSQPWSHRATSRSTSVFANLDQDIQNEAKAEWLDWGRYL